MNNDIIINRIKKAINPERELFKWGPIDFKFFYGSVFFKNVGVNIKNHYLWDWSPFLIIYHGGRMLWVQDYALLRKSGLNYFNKYFLEQKNFNSLWRKWESWIKEFKKRSRKWNIVNWEKITDEKLYAQIEDFFNFNADFWLIVHVPEIANWGGEHLLRNELEKISKDSTDSYMEILSAPLKYSFFQEEELDLLKLPEIKNKIEYKKKLNNHANKYHWLLNSYGENRILGPDYFDGKLKEILKNKTAKQRTREIRDNLKKNKLRKKELAIKLKLDGRILLIADMLSESIWWQDLRKVYIWQMHFYMDIFLNEISKRFGYELEILKWCGYDEFLEAIRKKGHAKLKEIAKRKDHYAVFSENKKFLSFSNKKDVKNILDFYREKVDNKAKKLKGMVVSKGKSLKIRGKIRIVHNPFKELKNFKKDEILVTGMTSPEYIILMKKAKAIITDYGGFTSHAAIVSRELDIPCVVGTKIATQVLKDGDMVEVDAERGVVKIIK